MGFAFKTPARMRKAKVAIPIWGKMKIALYQLLLYNCKDFPFGAFFRNVRRERNYNKGCVQRVIFRDFAPEILGDSGGPVLEERWNIFADLSTREKF